MCALCYTGDHHCRKGPYWSYTHPRRGRCSVIYPSFLLFIKIELVNLSFQPGFVRLLCQKIKVAIAKGLYGLYLNLPWELLWSSLKFFMISLRLSLCTNNMWKEETAVGKEQRGRNEKDQCCRTWNVNFISTVNSLEIGCFFCSVTMSDRRSALWGLLVELSHAATSVVAFCRVSWLPAAVDLAQQFPVC